LKKGELYKVILRAIDDHLKSIDAPIARVKPSRIRIAKDGDMTVISLIDTELYLPSAVRRVASSIESSLANVGVPRVVLDVSQVEGFGARFVSALSALYRNISVRGGELLLVGISPAMRVTCRVAALNSNIQVLGRTGDPADEPAMADCRAE
jgi:anti-anti-sigma regulatory factor